MRFSMRVCLALLLGSMFVLSLKPAHAGELKYPALPASLLQGANGKNTLVDFYSPHCGYCTRMEPTLNQLKKEYAGKIRFLRVDITQEKNHSVQDMYKVNGTPTYMIFGPDGKALYRVVGANSKQLTKAVKKHAAKKAAPVAAGAKPQG